MAQEIITKRQLLFIKAFKQGTKSRQEIIDYITRDDDIPSINRNMFNRDKDAIQNAWNLEINYNASTKKYSLNSADLTNHLEKLIHSFDIIYAIHRTQHLENILFLEPILVNQTQHFEAVLDAIENKNCITFRLNSFEQETSLRKCAPIAIKEANKRWYLIGYDLDKNAIRNYGLDRIDRLRIIEDKFKPIDFDVKKAYENAIGIETYFDVEEVILRFDNQQFNYVHSKPLHWSQNIIKQTNDTFDVLINVHPTHELIMEIFKFRDHCEVIAPKSLREEVKKFVLNLYYKYNK
ncbi:WYL domain-containing protein [Faecalibacter sp. LW9]|uniref:helix-turn-helix transcriptional regulator n=1 Tax=Faecalibacter sp. LW9 TaxID=3103144 RepID=UPI002AFFBC99|nr:WYL domain-containing protein [Faecalibacter sp. LW9]